MLIRKLIRTVGLYRAQFISMIIMITLGVGVFVGANMEWVSIRENTDRFFDLTGLPDYMIYSDTGITADDAEKVGKISGVTAVSRFVSVNADVKEQPSDSVALTVTENPDVSGFMLMSGEEYDPESTDGIWLSETYADKNGVKCGDSLTIVYKGIEISGKVKGLIRSGEYLICVRDESQLMPDYTTHGFAYISPAMYRSALNGYEYYPRLSVISDAEKDAFAEDVDRVLGKTLLVLSKDESASYSGASGEIEEGKTMGSVLPVLFLLIAVLTMVTTMHRLTAKEKTQIGTLKALGFKNRVILRHYTSYAFFIAAVGSILGIGFGYLFAWAIMNPSGSMGTYFDMPEWKLYLPGFCAVIVVAIIAVLTLIGYLSVREMLRGTAADALRPYSPKKVKPMLIERTKLFHRLSFGTRWNLRDTVRHKSRTAMSLIGTVGCMVLIVCAMGMKDTMDGFLDLYYNSATNYSSRIFLSEDASEEDRERIIGEYSGDSSATLSVKVGEKAVSLDIYSVTHDRVRFLNNSGKITEISDSGAYICRRISDEFGLKAGDSITFSPYGTDDEYTLTVAGVMMSVSENIVITKNCAEKAGITFTPDSVYTSESKERIAADSAIKSVQSKQAIIDSFDTFMEIMNLMIVILIAAALVLGIVVLYNLGVMSYTERYREMATLKVIGFGDKKIGRLLIGQNLWIAAVGTVIGLPAGIGALDYLIKALATEYEMKLVIGPVTCIVSIALTLGVSALVSVMIARKNRKIDMVEALKGAE